MPFSLSRTSDIIINIKWGSIAFQRFKTAAGCAFPPDKGAPLYVVSCIKMQGDKIGAPAVYRALNGDRGVWVRPAGMWLETVERDGVKYQRFAKAE